MLGSPALVGDPPTDVRTSIGLPLDDGRSRTTPSRGSCTGILQALVTTTRYGGQCLARESAKGCGLRAALCRFSALLGCFGRCGRGRGSVALQEIRPLLDNPALVKGQDWNTDPADGAPDDDDGLKHLPQFKGK